jgi:hypothetical protein
LFTSERLRPEYSLKFFIYDNIIKIFNDANGTAVSVLEIIKIANNSNQADLMLKYRESSAGNQGTNDVTYAAGLKSAYQKMENKSFVASSLFEKTK